MKKRIFAAAIGATFAVSAFAPIASVSANAVEISEVQQMPQEVQYGWLKDIFRNHDDDRPAPPPPRHEARRPAPPPPRHEARRPAPPPPPRRGPQDDNRGHGPQHGQRR